MIPNTRALETFTLAIAVSVTPLACAAGSPANGTDEAASTASEALSGAAPSPDSLLARLRLPGRARHKSDPAGTGSAQYTLCAAGTVCAGSLAQTEFAASFAPRSAEEGDGGGGCSLVYRGSCQVVTCPIADGGAGQAAGVSAGTLTLGGGSLGTIALAPERSEGFQYLFHEAGTGFAPGDTLTLEGSGGRVLAFPTQSLTAPGLPTLETPKADASGGYRFTTFAPVHVKWSGGTPGDVMFLEGDGTTSTQQRTLECAWDAAAGEGVLDASVLGAMAGSTGDFLWGEERQAVFDVGHYSINYAVINYGDAPAKYN